MKTLFLVRHAKSSWDDFSVSDHDRKLLPVGVQRTKKVAAWLQSSGNIPESIISSSAVRAFETAKILAQGMGFPVEDIQKEPALYGADEEDILAYLFGLPQSLNSVMLVGHNPAFTDLVNLFSEPGKQIDNLPTSAVAIIPFETSRWEEIPLAQRKTPVIVTPKML